ncbi:MAG: ECF-type sigma factor [Pirellula sp.]|jgi:RNA polymerase sigma factor (sigma-70 family)
MIPTDASVTNWLRKLEAGHDEAAQRLWNVFFDHLVVLVQHRLRSSPRGIADAEDVALSAFASFCLGVQKQRFPELSDRNGLWSLLVSITLRKLMHMLRDQNRLKRGGKFRQSPQMNDSFDGPTEIEQIIANEPTPEMAAQLAEQYEQWIRALDSEELVSIMQWKIEGFTNNEIAAKCGLTARTIERKLNLIRKILTQAASKEEIEIIANSMD